MTKIFMSLIFFAVIVILFASCSRHLRPTASISTKQGGNTIGDSAKKVKNPVYNTNTFSGDLVKNIVYSSAIDYQGTNQQLELDVYKPPNAGDKKFPAIVLIHGGSFIGGDKANLSSTCSKLAENGYVAISLNYRLGWGFISRAATTCSDTNKLKQAIFRAVQDTHAALNYIAVHAGEYNIDKDWIFLGGQSAGAITALTAAYLKPKDMNAFFPDEYVQKLGSLYRDSSANYTLKGVISMWGAFVNPELITPQTALPTIFFQGQLDKAVPFESRTFTPCPSATIVYGTHPLYDRLKALDVTTIAHVDPLGGHGVFEEDFRVSNILCFLNNVRQGVKKQVFLTGVVNSCDKQ